MGIYRCNVFDRLYIEEFEVSISQKQSVNKRLLYFVLPTKAADFTLQI